MIACWELRAGIQNKPIDFSIAELLDDGLREFTNAGETIQVERNCFNLARCAPARADDQAGIWRLADGVGGDLSETRRPAGHDDGFHG